MERYDVDNDANNEDDVDDDDVDAKNLNGISLIFCENFKNALPFSRISKNILKSYRKIKYIMLFR